MMEITNTMSTQQIFDINYSKLPDQFTIHVDKTFGIYSDPKSLSNFKVMMGALKRYGYSIIREEDYKRNQIIYRCSRNKEEISDGLVQNNGLVQRTI